MYNKVFNKIAFFVFILGITLLFSGSSVHALEQPIGDPTDSQVVINSEEEINNPEYNSETSNEVGESSDVDTINTDSGYSADNVNVINNDSKIENEKQDTDYSCGPAALVTWIRALGGSATESELIELAKTNSEEGTNFLNLKNAAIAKGYINAIVYKFTISDLNKITFPALVYLNVEGSEIGHYAVLTKVVDGVYYISDPQAGNVTKTEQEFLSEFGEYAMVNGNIDFTNELVKENTESIASSNNENSVINNNNLTTSTGSQTEVNSSATSRTTVASDNELSAVRGKGLPVVVLVVGSRVVVVAYHTAHHYFRFCGQRLCHVQVMTWFKGISGSHQIWRIPLPWK